MIFEARSYSWVTQFLSLILGCLFSELSHHAARRCLQPQGEDRQSSSRQQLQLKDQSTASMEHHQGVSQPSGGFCPSHHLLQSQETESENGERQQ